MIGYCAGGCGATVADKECFCKGCQWTITHQYKTSVVNRITAQLADTNGAPLLTRKLRNYFLPSEICANANATIRQPKIGFTTDPYFKAGV
jgi:hypothetical protein